MPGPQEHPVERPRLDAGLAQVADGVEEGEDVGVVLDQADDRHRHPVKDRGAQGIVLLEQRLHRVGQQIQNVRLLQAADQREERDVEEDRPPVELLDRPPRSSKPPLPGHRAAPSTSTSETAPVSAMKPSLTPMYSRIDIATTVPRNQTTTIVAKSGFGNARVDAQLADVRHPLAAAEAVGVHRGERDRRKSPSGSEKTRAYRTAR